ncbi:hypothetical protein BCS98_16165 [Vibrio breoganii]|uniref:DUF1481 domain-containing protein n=1 Tax=Vibrio breoganii TaxID=553239 RepID=UPI0002DE9833|nr:DUF1481 domain-containing protein [Vibrio breoganii]OED99462.1 hypothetical protein A1QG_00095 [Vibrio breoganii ZF-29]PMM17096.1 hypothetical protein BCT59_15105 [Vibrio breoganii]PMO89678.1 hypothetical protein BCS98_16165 [Vibrio breoganii]
MKHFIASALAILTLAGCSSATTPLRQSAQITEYSGGEIDNTKTSLFWLTERFYSPESSSDDVIFKDKTWYKSHYTWDSDNLREMSRTGERLSNSGDLIPFQMTLRFSGTGEAVYQRLRINGKVMPMRKQQIDDVKQQASDLIAKGKKQQKQGLELIQGYWEEGAFVTCEGRTFTSIEFKDQLPSFVIDRLIDEDHFVAFIGEYKAKKIVVDKMLMLKNGGYECIERPSSQS